MSIIPGGCIRDGRNEADEYECGSHLDEFRSSGSACTDPTKGCVGGYSRIKTVIDKKRKTKKNSLLLNAGDEFQVSLVLIRSFEHAC